MVHRYIAFPYEILDMVVFDVYEFSTLGWCDVLGYAERRLVIFDQGCWLVFRLLDVGEHAADPLCLLCGSGRREVFGIACGSSVGWLP